MSDASPDYLNQELRQRVDQVFYGSDYESAPASDWLEDDEEEYDLEGYKPLLAWEREAIGRDIFNSLEVTVTDKLALLESVTGELVMERVVFLETENDEGDEEDCLTMNMYDGQIFYENEVRHETAAQEFNNRFRIVEDL